MLAVPMIDGEIEKGQIEPERIKAKSSHRYDKLISDLFPEDDWIRDNCKILDAKQSVLFFKEAKQMEDGNWEVKPFTMFLNPDSTLAESLEGDHPSVKKDKPIILRTDEGAYIKFEDGSAPNSPSGKFSGARMPGKVIVMREESTPGAKDSFEFKTTNIQVEKTQILAVNPVQFKYGPHYGSGHNLTINLADVGFEKKKRKRHLPIVRNLKTVELAHLDSITLMPDEIDVDVTAESTSKEASNKPPSGTDGPKSALETSVAKSPVEIKCAGPFRLDFGKSQMVLFDQVHVEQLHKEGLHDHLYCDRLEIDFIIRNGNQAPAEVKDKIHFHRVTAFGAPARLLVDSKDAYAQADFIEYFIGRQIIHCRSNVELRDGSHQFIAPEMQYKLTKNNQLGTGWATGPGQIIGNPGDLKKHFTASWQSEFNIQPHEGKKAISLHGNAHIIFQGDQHFGCDELHFWLWEKRQKGANAKWDFFPAQLLGQRSVTMNAPEFAGEVNELRVFWPKPIGTIPTDPRINNRLTNKTSKQKNSRTGDKQLVSDSGKTKLQEDRDEETNEPIENRVIANGQIAIAYLTDKNELRSFRVEKDVRVKSIDLTPLLEGKSARDMLEVHGNEIQIDATNKKDAFKFSVLGSPATIDADGIRFISEQLHVDQSLNQAWTDFPGQVIVSPEIKADERPFGPQPETTIRWNKRFEFDGQIIILTDDIQFEGIDYLESGDQVEYEGSTPILKARTNRRIDFSESLKKTNTSLARAPQANPNRSNTNQVGYQNTASPQYSQASSRKSAKPKIKISDFAMLEKAYIKATTREAINEIKSIDEIQAREINLNTITGDTRAMGPGNVRSIRKGEKKQSGQQSENLLSGISSSKSKLSYMEIAFAGNIRGNVKQRTATVNENVRCVYGPAENWETRYDPDGTTITADEIYLNANQLTFNQWKPTGSEKALIELAAIGNTEIEGKKFRATATQLTYTEENEIILLEGLQRDTAKIWFRKNENSQWQHSEAKKFRYQRQTSEIIGSEDVLVQRFLQLEAPQLKRRKR